MTQAFGDAAATGSVALAARRDHKHGMPAAPATPGGGARVYNSGTVPVAASTETVVTFDSERSDSAAYHSTSSNTGRLTIPTGGAGRFSVTGTVEWAASALGTLRRLSIRLNGTTYIAKDEITSIINAVLPQTVTTIYDLADGDYVELVAFQDTVGSVNLGASGNYSPEFALTLGGVGSAGIDNWLIDINPAAGSHGNTNWSTLNTSGGIGGSDTESSGAQNDEIYWDLGVSGGTWDITVVYYRGNNRGIATVSVDGVSAGTIDFYNASAVVNQIGTITGVSITAGKRRLKLKMATKNGSSSSYFGTIQWVQLRRTA